MLYIPALRYTSLKVQYHKKIPLFSTFFSRIPANRTNRIVGGRECCIFVSSIREVDAATVSAETQTAFTKTKFLKV